MKNFEDSLYNQYISTGQVNVDKDPLNVSIFNKFITKRFIINQVKPHERIVDLGCGYGQLVSYLNSINFNALGIEISNELYQLSKNIGISSVIHGDIFEFLVKQESKSIKLIILNDILEHFAVEEAINLLKLSYSKLSDDGFIIGHVPCATGIFSNRVRYGDLTHKLAFTTQSLEQLRKFCNYNSLIVFEDKPLGNSIKGVLRRFIWNIICLRYRFIYFIETGEKKVILSQNLTFKLSKN